MYTEGGDTVASFERIYEEHCGFIYKYLLKLCCDPSLAEELTQECFYRAYINFAQLRDHDRAAAWLCRIARNCYYAWYGESRKEAALDEELPADAPDLAEAFVQKELSARAFARLHELEEPYREVFMLSVFANLPLKEISALFGKSESWARVTLCRARKKLMERLK